MKNLLIVGLLLSTLFACKRDKDDPYQQGGEEAKKLESTLKNQKYVIASIVDELGGDSRSAFPACIGNDTFHINAAKDIEIRFGDTKCGKESGAFARQSWNIAYNSDMSVRGISWPVFLNGMDYYTVRLFEKGNYSLDGNTGALQLIFPVNGKKYTVKLVQTL